MNFRHLLPFSLGKYPCDLIFRDVTYLDVFSGAWARGDVALHEGRIVALEAGLKAIREINAKGKFLVPGFIDAHVHVESALVTPRGFENMVLKRGTTTAICDPHELTNVLGTRALQYFLDEASGLHLNLKVMLSSCVPATHLETNGGGILNAQDLLPFKSHPHALGLAEMMNVPGVIFGDESVHAKLEAFHDVPIDGHAPLLRGGALSAYALCGITSCHESSELEEAREKLTKGIAVWIREGSVAKDLNALAPLLTSSSSLSLGFCTDDRNPLDIATEGHLDYLIRESIRLGASPIDAYRAASFSVALHYGLNRGPQRIGAIAPGFIADLILLNDPRNVSIHSVWKGGRDVLELETKSDATHVFQNTIRIDAITESDLDGVKGLVNIIRVLPGKILTEHEVKDSESIGVAKLSVIERYGRKSKPANAYVSGFGDAFQGAIASSVGHDSHNLICVGSSAKDMKIAVTALACLGGGFCVVKDGKVLSEFALPFGGLMSFKSPEEIAKNLRDLRQASLATGCILHEPFLQLAFLSLPVIPKLKLTDKGLVDVDGFRLIPVAV